MKTLFISDLDGTLLQPDAKLSQYTINTINQLIDKGMLFTVATARSEASIKHILKDLKITVPLILMNGVCTYDFSKQKYIKIETLPEESLRILLDMIKKFNLQGFIYTIKDGVLATYYQKLNSQPLKSFYEERVNLYKKAFYKVEDFELLKKEPIIYFTLMDHKEKLLGVYQYLSKVANLNCTFYKDNYSPEYWYLEVFSKYASKFYGTQYLRSYLGVDSVVAFGDNLNDLALFEASDIKIAVSNGAHELKKKATHIIGKNTEDAVANWLLENANL